MKSGMHKFLEFVFSFWRQVLGGVITTGIVAILVYLYRNLTPQFLLVGVILLALLIIVLLLLFGRTHKVLVYVSSGSTCRDPMAKAITKQLLAGRKLRHPVDVHAVGLVPSGNEASYGARQAIKEMYGADLLKEHKPAAFTDELVNKANLILVMDKGLFDATENTLPRNKTHVLKEFFGLKGDVADPWRSVGERDLETLERYKTCAKELEEILSKNIDTLLNALGAV